jgi:nitrate reductase NapD
MPISGIVITCQADRTSSIVSSIRESGVAEVHGTSPEGKVVAVIEAPSVEDEVRIVRSLAGLEGVINVHLAYHHIEDIPDPIGSC